MRVATLLALAAAFAACVPSSTEPPALDPATPEAGGAPSPTASGWTVRTDSLVESDSALQYVARISYPQVEAVGDPLPTPVEAANAAVVDSVRALAASFRPEAAPPGVAVTPYPVEVTGQVGEVHVTDGLLSALVSIYAYTGGAHGNTFFLPLNFDLTTGRPVRLGDLFREGTAYGDTLAAYVEREVTRQLAAQIDEPVADARRMIYTEGLDDFREGRFAFTLGPDALHVHVPPYQLASYAAGTFDVAVPYAALRPFAAPGTPLPRLGAE